MKAFIAEGDLIVTEWDCIFVALEDCDDPRPFLIVDRFIKCRQIFPVDEPDYTYVDVMYDVKLIIKKGRLK